MENVCLGRRRKLESNCEIRKGICNGEEVARGRSHVNARSGWKDATSESHK
jgi:hypothetical protein